MYSKILSYMADLDTPSINDLLSESVVHSDENNPYEDQYPSDLSDIQTDYSIVPSSTSSRYSRSSTMTNGTGYLFAAIVTVIALAGGYITMKNTDDFYESLLKPSWAPSVSFISFVFTVMYVLIGYLTYNCYIKAREQDKTTLMVIFVVQLLLNFFWTYVFFGLKNPRAARIIICLLVIMVLLQMLFMYNIDRKSTYLMSVYLAWVGFVSYLNYEIVRLNQM